MAELRRMRPLLGTFVEIGAQGDELPTRRAVDRAFSQMEALHRALSFQDPGSELSRLNAVQGTWVSLGALSLQVLRLARAVGIVSGDRFNCTVGGQLQRWGLLPRHDRAECLPEGRSSDIELRRGQARLRRPVRVTLDGIAKGFAVDRAIDALVRGGCTFGWVNAGGDVRVFGERCLQLQRRDIDGTLSDLLQLNNRAVASSVAAGTTQPDLPARIAGVAAGTPATVVSVMARTGWRADALTKVAAATAPAQRNHVVEQLGGTLLCPGGN